MEPRVIEGGVVELEVKQWLGILRRLEDLEDNVRKLDTRVKELEHEDD